MEAQVVAYKRLVQLWAKRSETIGTKFIIHHILPLTLASPRGLHVHQNMFVVTQKKYTKNSRSEVSGHFGPRSEVSIGHFGPT